MHHQQRHEVLEHAGRPANQHVAAPGGREGPAQPEPVLLRHVALGDGEEAGQAALAREQVVVGRVKAALGRVVADGEELAAGVVEHREVGVLPHLAGDVGDEAQRREQLRGGGLGVVERFSGAPRPRRDLLAGGRVVAHRVARQRGQGGADLGQPLGQAHEAREEVHDRDQHLAVGLSAQQRRRLVEHHRPRKEALNDLMVRADQAHDVVERVARVRRRGRQGLGQRHAVALEHDDVREARELLERGAPSRGVARGVRHRGPAQHVLERAAQPRELRAVAQVLVLRVQVLERQAHGVRDAVERRGG